MRSGGDAALVVNAVVSRQPGVSKETVEVFVAAIRAIVFLEQGRKKEWGGDGLVVFFRVK